MLFFFQFENWAPISDKNQTIPNFTKVKEFKPLNKYTYFTPQLGKGSVTVAPQHIALIHVKMSNVIASIQKKKF